jgi:hypothetical protein
MQVVMLNQQGLNLLLRPAQNFELTLEQPDLVEIGTRDGGVDAARAIKLLVEYHRWSGVLVSEAHMPFVALSALRILWNCVVLDVEMSSRILFRLPHSL